MNNNAKIIKIDIRTLSVRIPLLSSHKIIAFIAVPPVDIDGIREPVAGSLLYGSNIISGAYSNPCKLSSND